MPSDSSDANDQQHAWGDLPSQVPRTVPRWVWPAVLIGTMVVLYAVMWKTRQSVPDQGTSSPAAGKRLQALQLDPLVNVQQPLSLADLQQQVVLLNYWGTWCPPCRIEMPHLLEIYEQFHQRADFRMVSVSCYASLGGDPEQLRLDTAKYLQRLNASDSFPVYSDLQAISRRQLMQSAELPDFVFPTTVVLDRQGTILGLWRDYQPGMEKQIQRALESAF